MKKNSKDFKMVNGFVFMTARIQITEHISQKNNDNVNVKLNKAAREAFSNALFHYYCARICNLAIHVTCVLEHARNIN